MGLETYRKKRNFSRTPEPSGELSPGFYADVERIVAVPPTGHPLYMVHDHHSRNHHHDLRLEFNGVLRSWAIPKLIDPADLHARKLAVRTEDHPLAYGYWEGVIPEGEYGAGKSMIWDTGTFRCLEEGKDKLIVEIAGKKLKGTFVLIHFRPQERNWLFFKKK